MAAYVVVRLLLGKPVLSVVSYATDGILLVAVFLFTAYYRSSLDENKISLKEAMLFGTGTSIVAALVFGLAVWVVGVLYPQQDVIFTRQIMNKEITTTDPEIHYWAAWWAIVAAVSSAVLGSFGAFVAAIVFRNEKSEIKHKKV